MEYLLLLIIVTLTLDGTFFRGKGWDATIVFGTRKEPGPQIPISLGYTSLIWTVPAMGFVMVALMLYCLVRKGLSK